MKYLVKKKKKNALCAHRSSFRQPSAAYDLQQSILFYKKLIDPFFLGFTKERLRKLGHILQMKDDRLPKVLICIPSIWRQTKCRLSPNGVRRGNK